MSVALSLVQIELLNFLFVVFIVLDLIFKSSFAAVYVGKDFI